MANLTNQIAVTQNWDTGPSNKPSPASSSIIGHWIEVPPPPSSSPLHYSPAPHIQISMVTVFFTNLSLRVSTVENGLAYEWIKHDQLTAVERLLNREDMFMSVPMRFYKSPVYQVLLLCT